ncbi:MAG: DNA primase [Gemmatimonadaceae bacterium]
MIPDEVVDQVREHADIVAIVGELVKLKRVGTSYRGPCPFHQGKDPNFSVSPKGGFNCFVCHEKGDVFTFVQKRLGLDFVEAVKYVGGKSGVDVREVSRDRAGEKDPREGFWEINAAAAEFFRAVLWDDSVGAPAREYLAGRRLARDVADRFGLGFAPRDPGLLRAHLEKLGFDDSRRVASGLFVVRNEGEESVSRFRNRLMFPIYDVQARVIAFGGRVIGPGEPKYLNSAESPTFSKGSTLYGLNWAKQAIRREERVLLVEGYFDCLRLITSGVECTIAPLGTALTEAQAELIRKYTRTVFLLYDSDRAGLKATFRAGDVLLRQGIKVHVVTLPEGDDPDTYVNSHGREQLEALLANAIDVFERKLQILQRGGWFADLRRKRVALDHLMPTLRSASDLMTRGLYLARAAETVGVSPQVLEEELRQPQPKRQSAPAYRGEAPAAPRARTQERRPEFAAAGVSAERELIRLLIHRRHDIEVVAERVGVDSFRERSLSQIFTRLLELPDEPLDSLADTLDDDVVAVLNDLAASRGGLDLPVRIIDDCLSAFRQREIGEEMELLDRRLSEADPAQQDELMSAKNRLQKEMQTLGMPRRWKSFGRTRS